MRPWCTHLSSRLHVRNTLMVVNISQFGLPAFVKGVRFAIELRDSRYVTFLNFE